MNTNNDTPGILTLDTTTTATVFNISYYIPPQVMILKSIRIEMSSAVTALAARVLYLDLPFLNGNQVIDGNPGRTMLPILLDNATVTLRTSLDLPIWSPQSIPKVFNVYVRDGGTFAEAANFVSMTVQFALSKGGAST